MHLLADETIASKRTEAGSSGIAPKDDIASTSSRRPAP